MDSAHKLTILASIAFGIPLDYASVAVEGITRVVPQDIQIAQVFGYRIKLLGIAKRSAAGVELRVHPTLVPDTALLAKVDRSEEHTSELQSLMRISYAVFCLKKKNQTSETF